MTYSNDPVNTNSQPMREASKFVISSFIGALTNKTAEIYG